MLERQKAGLNQVEVAKLMAAKALAITCLDGALIVTNNFLICQIKFAVRHNFA